MNEFFKKTHVLWGLILGLLLSSAIVLAIGLADRIVFSAGSKISSADVNTNFEELYKILGVGAYASHSPTGVPASCPNYLTCQAGVDLGIVTTWSVEFGAISFTSGVFAAVAEGIYKIELIGSPIISSPSAGCMIPRITLKIDFNSGTDVVSTGKMLKKVYVGDTVSFTAYMDDSSATGACSVSVDYSPVSVLIRRVF